VLDAAMRHAGAIRLDHVMGLRRLYLIPQGRPSSDGAYVGYPLGALLSVVAAASTDRRTIVIGEDLGTVPHGFRDTMREANIQGYRVLFFEREHGGGFRPPAGYDRSALACVSTHDLPTLAGWWSGRDIAERLKIGLLADEGVEAARAGRLADRRAMVVALDREGLLPAAQRGLAHPDASLPDRLDDALAVATHRLVARTPCRLVAVQLEDLVGSEEGVNVPGTTVEYPNWRRKLPVELEQLEASALFKDMCRAMSEERPRTP
jgi:4-alpha-glucanotransferase